MGFEAAPVTRPAAGDRVYRPPKRLLEPIRKRSSAAAISSKRQSNQFSFVPGSQMILTENDTMIFHPDSNKTSQGKAKNLNKK